MNIRVVTTPWQSSEADWLIVGVPEEAESSGPSIELDTPRAAASPACAKRAT